MNKSYNANELFTKYKNGTATDEEIALIESWQLSHHPEYGSPITEAQRQQDLQEIRANLVLLSSPVRKAKLWPRIALAAAAMAVLTLGTWLYHSENTPSTPFQHQADIAPGKQGATLTLSDGRKIRLAEAATGEIDKQNGIRILKTKDGQLLYQLKDESAADNKTNTLSTANGETYQITLPDGTKVWLNAASSLSYNTRLINSGKRQVRLHGEAYFQVAKDSKHPFIVASKDQTVEVLGTHFNISAYQDEQITKTTLLEGSVKIYPGHNKQKAVTIRPGQQAQSSAKSQILVTSADTEEAIAWTKGDIQFDHKTMPEIMQQIARWYDVQVVYQGEVPTGEWSGSVSRLRPLSQVLKMMSKSKEVRFRLEGKTIYLSQ